MRITLTRTSLSIMATELGHYREHINLGSVGLLGNSYNIDTGIPAIYILIQIVNFYITSKLTNPLRKLKSYNSFLYDILYFIYLYLYFIFYIFSIFPSLIWFLSVLRIFQDSKTVLSQSSTQIFTIVSGVLSVVAGNILLSAISCHLDKWHREVKPKSQISS